MNSFLIGTFLNFAGPVALLGFVLWLYSLRGIVKFSRSDWLIPLLSLAGAGIFFGSTAIDFKVLSDETNLLSVANMLTRFGKASNTEMGVTYYHLFHAINLAVPTRPVLFPVFISLVQFVVGVKQWTPFVVNFLFTVALFWLTLDWARARLKAKIGPLGLSFLALLMSPILAIVATSAGYDLCSVFFGFACFRLLQRYEEKGDSETLQALLLGLVCYATVRYESIAALPIFVAALFFFEGISWLKKIPLSTAAVLCVMLALLVIQRLLGWGNFENPPGVAPFSFGHFVDHWPSFGQSFFLDGRGPYPILLHWLGVMGIVLGVKQFGRYGWVAAAYLVFLFLLLLCHHFGFANHPTQARLFLPLSFALSLSALYALSRMEEWGDPRSFLAIFFLLFVHHHQYAVHDPLMTELTMTREMRHLRTFLAEEPHAEDLFIYDRPGQLTAIGFSSVSWDYFEAHKAELMLNLRNHLYQKIIVIERVPYGGDPEKFGLIRAGYRLSPLRENQLTGTERLRLSRVDW